MLTVAAKPLLREMRHMVALSVDALEVAEVEGSDKDTMQKGHDRTRDEWQIKLDELVKKAKDRWEAAGKPDTHQEAVFKAAVKTAMTMPKTDVSPCKGMLRRAGTLHKVDILYAENQTNPSGSVTVRFCVGPYTPPKPPKAKTKNTPADGVIPNREAEGGEPQGEPQGEQRGRFRR